MSQFEHINTALIHGGISNDARTGAVNVPIYQTSTYQQDGLGKMRGYEYSRTGNPTREALEALIAELEEGVAGFAFASGMAAITAVLSLLHAGDRVLISSNVYGGTFRLLAKVFDHFNISYTIADTTDAAKFEADITDDVKAVIIESPANPLMTVTDIREIADISHKHGSARDRGQYVHDPVSPEAADPRRGHCGAFRDEISRRSLRCGGRSCRGQQQDACRKNCIYTKFDWRRSAAV